jgi:hypothetical protein
LRWSFNDNTIEASSWGSKHELLDFLRACKSGHVILGENTEHVREFLALKVNLGWSGVDCFGVGVYSEGHGLAPHILPYPGHSLLFLGFNANVVGLNINRKGIDFELSLETLFRCFLPVPHLGFILVFHEIGVTGIDEYGQQQWQYSKDIITNCRLDGHYVSLEFMDSKSVSINILDGSER